MFITVMLLVGSSSHYGKAKTQAPVLINMQMYDSVVMWLFLNELCTEYCQKAAANRILKPLPWAISSFAFYVNPFFIDAMVVITLAASVGRVCGQIIIHCYCY